MAGMEEGLKFYPHWARGASTPGEREKTRGRSSLGGRSEGPSSQCVTLTSCAMVCWREWGRLRPLASLFPLGLPTQDALPSAYPGGYSAGKALSWAGASSKGPGIGSRTLGQDGEGPVGK